MNERLELTWDDVHSYATQCAARICRHQIVINDPMLSLWGVPNGGTHALAAIYKYLSSAKYRLAETAEDADCIVDDLIDSGKTQKMFVGKPFFALLNKKDLANPQTWVSFPWERMQKNDGPQDNIRRLLQYIGEDPEREGLKETPDRIVRSYSELFSGYKKSVDDVFKTFTDSCDEMVILKNIEFTSFCEHHMLPFTGQASIAYIPDGRVIGLSKMARLLEVFARRLQVQERLTVEVTKALDEHLKPLGSACLINAKHMCMCARGVNKQHSSMVTSSLTGVFRQPEVRAEFFTLVRS